MLVVDDVPNNRDLLHDHLKSLGFTVYDAENGLQSIEMAKEYIPELIFMDIRMPVMDGYEATSKLKEDQATKSIPVIGCTASVLRASEKDILAKGFAGYLRKPILLDDIVQQLSRFIKWKKVAKKKTPSKKPDRLLKPEEIVLLKKNVSSVWEQLKKKRSTKLQKELAKILIQTGKTLDNKQLINHGEALENAIKSFNIELINELISEFENYLK